MQTAMEKVVEKKGLLAKLFDLSFSEFVAVDVVKVLYVLSLVGAALVTLLVVIAGFGQGILAGVGSLVLLGPLIFLSLALVARLSAEVVLVLFRIAENIQLIVDEAMTGSEGPRKDGPRKAAGS